MDEAERHINKREARTAKGQVSGDRKMIQKQTNQRQEPASNRQILVYMRLEPDEGKLSRPVLRREGAE